MPVRVCPCGVRIEKKPKESQAQFEKRDPKYCSVGCKGKYHQHPPARRAFGNAVPEKRARRRLGAGFLRYLDGRPE